MASWGPSRSDCEIGFSYLSGSKGGVVSFCFLGHCHPFRVNYFVFFWSSFSLNGLSILLSLGPSVYPFCLSPGLQGKPLCWAVLVQDRQIKVLLSSGPELYILDDTSCSEVVRHK